MHICTLTCLALLFTCCAATSGRTLREYLGPGARQLGENSSRKARQARVCRGRVCVLRRFVNRHAKPLTCAHGVTHTDTGVYVSLIPRLIILTEAAQGAAVQ